MALSAEDGNALSTAAFVLDCLKNARPGVDRLTRIGEDWQQGAPWLEGLDNDVTKAMEALNTLHTQNSNATIPSQACQEWLKRAPGDRDSFRMIPGPNRHPPPQSNSLSKTQKTQQTHPPHKRGVHLPLTTDPARFTKHRKEESSRCPL